jgi:Na+-transporting NADH:ubiquinone oxidoreductase subunit C
MQQFSTTYTYGFSLALCLACSILLSVAAVGLKERQLENAALDKQKSVLQACRIIKAGDSVTAEQVEELFAGITPKVIDLETDTYLEGDFDPDEIPMLDVPGNEAKLSEVPQHVQVFHVMEEGKMDMMVLPISGKGLWGTLYGFLAVSADTNTIRGITYYNHKETPGLGGEVDNPQWKSYWPDRKIYDADWNVAIRVIKGAAESPESHPHRVNGLSGATITSRGVTDMLQFWLGEEGFGPYLEEIRESGSV